MFFLDKSKRGFSKQKLDCVQMSVKLNFKTFYYDLT